MHNLFPMRPIKPIMLPMTPEDYWVEPKYNGWNVVLPGDGTAWSRHGKEMTHWKCFQDEPLRFPHPVCIELVNKRGGGSAWVSKLRNGKTAREDVLFAAYDVMVEGMVIECRQKLLRSILPSTDQWVQAPRCAFSTWKAFNEFLFTTMSRGAEGVVLKKKQSLYFRGKVSSVESPHWIKIKNPVGTWQG